MIIQHYTDYSVSYQLWVNAFYSANIISLSLCPLLSLALRSQQPLAQLYGHSSLENHHYNLCLFILNNTVSTVTVYSLPSFSEVIVTCVRALSSECQHVVPAAYFIWFNQSKTIQCHSPAITLWLCDRLSLSPFILLIFKFFCFFKKVTVIPCRSFNVRPIFSTSTTFFILINTDAIFALSFVGF